MSVQYGVLIAPIVAKTGKDAEVAEFIDEACSIVDGPMRFHGQWFAAQYEGVTPTTFAVFQTFSAGPRAFLDSELPKVLSANAAKFAGVPQISHVEVLGSKVDVTEKNSRTAGLAVGSRVLLEANPGKEQDLRELLIWAVSEVETEPTTLVWYPIYFPGTSTFGIIDFFADDAAKNAHIAGKVGQALAARASELLAAPLDIVNLDVLLAKIT